MPDVATTRPSSTRPSARSSSATGEGESRYGPDGASANTVPRARDTAGHSSGVKGRSWEERSSATRSVYLRGPTWGQPISPGDDPPMTRSWAEMMTGIAERLQATTGEDVATWSERVRTTALGTEPEGRAGRAERGITGYAQMVLVMERFGYPAFLTASADELIDAQYADRPALRPVFDAVVSAALGLGEMHVQARKGYVPLVGPRRTFAV